MANSLKLLIDFISLSVTKLVACELLTEPGGVELPTWKKVSLTC